MKQNRKEKKKTIKTIKTIWKGNIIACILFFCVCTGFFTCGKTAAAAVEPWMATAGTIQLNSGVSGIASNNVAPTLMDPWWSYERYYYFYVPSTMNITVDVSVTGTEPFEGVYLLDSNGNRLKEVWKSAWTYSRNTNSSRMRYTVQLRAGSYYLKQWDIYRDNQSVRFTTRVNAELSGNPGISKIKKTSRTAAKLTWRKVSGANGYEIYRSTSANGTYKKIKTVSGGKKSFKNKGLKARKTYYYKVRAYKRINGRVIYSGFSAKKKIKM